jgi:asparagine synthase (glutamine-hydrolysing)
VESQLISDVPVGAFLSGGLDSSAIVACARKHLSKERFPCFTISHAKGSKDGFAEDLPYAMKVAKELDVDLNVLEIQPSMVENLDRMLWHLDEPLADPAAINVLLIAESAKRSGVSVLLSGAGGDDLFTGYRRHFALQSERYWSWFPKPFRSLLKRGSSLLPTRHPMIRRLSKAFAYADRSSLDRMMSYFCWAPPEVIAPLLTSKVWFERDFCEPLLQSLDRYTGGQDDEPLKKMLFLEMSHFLVDHNLNYTDKLSMAVGVETRVPFLDPRMVDYACRLPITYKQVGRQSKYILKKAMEGILPADVIYRPKTGFSAPLRTWLHGDMRELLDTVLSKNNVEGRGLFNHDQIQRIIAMDRKGQADYSYVIFSLVAIERWCQLFLDSPKL